MSHLRGDPSGHVIVEYGDYECPYSRRAYRSIQRVEASLEGQVAFEFRHFPPSYTDDGSGSATETTDTEGVWTISPPLTNAAHLAGSGKAVVEVATTRPNANVVVDVYDLDQNGTGPLVTRQGFLARSAGEKTLDLWSADWKIPADHRIAVRVTDANEDWWIHAPLFDTVDVVGGSVTLPFLTFERTDTIQGDPGAQLEGYLNETITVPPETLRDSESPSFNLPPAQQPEGAPTD